MFKVKSQHSASGEASTVDLPRKFSARPANQGLGSYFRSASVRSITSTSTNGSADDDAVSIASTQASSRPLSGGSSGRRWLKKRQPKGVRKSVHFIGEEGESSLATVVTTLPLLSPGDIENTYYTSNEMKQMKHHARLLGEQVSSKDKKVCPYLQFSYGLTFSIEDMTAEMALKYFYYLQATEDDDSITTIRGLEKLIAPMILDHRKECIQAVMNTQLDIVNSKEDVHSEEAQNLIRKHSSKASICARRF
eukprot:CAMPEP_0198145866 /NCGR_PEP_ID=MMETSP1443-20131203/25859_1 /TAXON_ID=186043 /ORGANISM="Entomoneis sp., Strain CCMP2396" /LENGTH=249 /DNA_ID=CAMNT_0043809621 /DNA_START=31 /DNA_END=777 /DNA_ORIENTATION=-